MPRLLLALLCTLFVASHAGAQSVEVRVLLERVEGTVRVSIAEGHQGYAGARLVFETPFALDWPLAAQGGRLTVDEAAIAGPFTLEPRSGKVSWGGRQYRGALSFLARDDELLVINVVDLEEYLRGVIPAEVMAAWPLEALKAQAVASRTYTVSSLDPAADYDICATIDCQVYSGVRVEHLRSDRAVAETAGLVLTYGGRLARTYYHADSGGVLASSAEVWGTALPYLAARRDVAFSTPHRRWRLSLDPSLMTEALEAAGYRVGRVSRLRVTSYSDSGRAERAEVIGAAGNVALSGSRLTAFLRTIGLKSTRFAMVGDLVAEGDGWGHGVGMSQYGARALAESGYRFDQILTFYYPETQLQRLAADGGEESP